MTSAGSIAVSWNTHALLTRFALRSSQWDFLRVKSPVVPLQEFLFAAGSGLPSVINHYENALAIKGCTAASEVNRMGEVSSEAQFLEALRLNPQFQLHYVRGLKLREVSSDSPHDMSRSGPPSVAYIPTPPGDLISAHRVLSTFSDEPDWGIDQDLFAIERYGYGTQSYGPVTGPSSQAPFHMAFFSEPMVLLWLVPSLKRNFVEERVNVFHALAKLAFARGIDYWGWRFTAWAMHYLQDLTQPYHARALPFSLLRILKRIITAGLPSGFFERDSNLLRNRHALFEAVAHFLLNKAVKKGAHRALVRALSGGGDAKDKDVRVIMMSSAKVVSRMAIRVNMALEKCMDEPRLNDPSRSLDFGPNYHIDMELARAARDRPRSYKRFMALLGTCLGEAGKVTRYVVRTAASTIGS